MEYLHSSTYFLGTNCKIIKDVLEEVLSSIQQVLLQFLEQLLLSWHTLQAKELSYVLFSLRLNSKALTRELAVIHARENIRVNALCPGPLKTELLMKYLNTEEKRQRRLVHVPMGRFGQAEEIAKSVLFLASDEVFLFILHKELTYSLLSLLVQLS